MLHVLLFCHQATYCSDRGSVGKNPVAVVDIVESLNLYQEAFNLYDTLVNDINGISEKVKWARVRFRVRKTAAIIGWVISVIASAIISAVFSCELVSRFL